MDRDYKKWLTILTQLEREIIRTFPPKEVKVGDQTKEVEDPRRRAFKRDFSAIRGTLRNYQKLEKT